MDNTSLKSLVKEKEIHETYEVASKEDIEKTENDLNYKLPKSYCDFVSQFSNGAFLYMIQEVSAVGDGNKQILSIQRLSLQRMTSVETHKMINIREGGSVEIGHLIPFSLDHNGNAWCFIANQMKNEEYKVAYFDSHNPKLYGILDNFNEWLKVLIDNREEVIRILYDDNVISTELGLG
ncbi:SMI1/KNR4 family protein [Paenibacillus sp. Y412MC10]|uniref:SMI1/KNR4 family protein n=1 Tax=Geobacillus sp. (strain Y412MC10) TaxID=481743 RepID=UPI000178A09E|nr:SMI1/KNR4 family protein [Paenibacillus sp. Y412MC10]ACX65445.1 Cell wall assembly/cell proliferation coordinating protein, KNR4-like protein [Paenibacillus sp. Y412MC10]